MCFRIPADEVMLKHCSHCTAPDLSVDGALGSVSRVVLSQFHQTLLDGLEGVGGGEPYSEPSQQVEEAEAGESHDRTPMPVWRSHTQALL